MNIYYKRCNEIEQNLRKTFSYNDDFICNISSIDEYYNLPTYW